MTCEHNQRDFSEEVGPITFNAEVAPGAWEMRIKLPQMTPRVKPGQFVHLLISKDSPRILRRPFSVYGAEGDELSLLYQVVGAGTREMTALDVGTELSVIGPIGRGWNPPVDARNVLLVTGGLGAAPLAMLAEALRAEGVEVSVAMGAPTAVRLVGKERYLASACTIDVATDDGSEGESGYCTDVAKRLIVQNSFDYIATCGPEPMQRIVAEMAGAAKIPCEVSLERRMACGIGACLSCVVSTTDGLKRACVDGPVFDAQKVVWNA